jgi:predicted component of type VI protein secretion system
VREQEVIAQVQAMPEDQLRDTRRDLEAGIGLMRPQSPMYAPASAYLAAVNAELARRAEQQA